MKIESIAPLSLPLLATAKLGGTVHTRGLAKYSHNGDDKTLRLTVVNTSYQQPFSGFFVMTHSSSAPPLFTLGTNASAALADLAENGNPGDLVDLYNGTQGVCSATTAPGPLGGSVTDPTMDILVTVNEECPLVTIASMAVNTNDCFVAINGEELEAGDVGEYAGLDAGSEQNNEMCSSIPGPACALVEGNTADGMGEGFVHVHRGFFGVGDVLSKAGYDWRNPMMVVMVSDATDEGSDGAISATTNGSN